MQRRRFLTLIGGSAAWPIIAHAQQSTTPVIGFLSSASPIGWDKYLAAFRDGLRENGFVEGKNVAIEYRWANGSYEQLPKLAAELVGLRVAIIVASGGAAPAVAAKISTSIIPIVFTGVPNPVELGLIASLNRPAGNLTGLSILTTEVLPKRFELLSALVPTAAMFGLLANPTNATYGDEIKVAHVAVGGRGKSLITMDASSESDFEPAFDTLVHQNCGALILTTDAFFNNHRDAIIALAGRHRIPTMYGWPEFPRAGGLASYGPDLSDQYRLSGVFVGRILKGEKPQDLPVMQPTKFNFVLNLKTMKALNIEAPANILALADEVIE
jgi:putative tryptophan/tyrosine transport system substrate-binding protein